MSVRGVPMRTKTGELSIRPLSITVLSPCIRMLPTLHTGLIEQETRYRNRYLDFIVNRTTTNKFVVFRQIMKTIRNFLEERDFEEVKTPILSSDVGGASATPFVSRHHETGLDLNHRIAPELYLKKLIIGGYKRIYEIGSQFRNEGVDRTHHPEFTTCEFYMADANYNHLINLTEELLSGMVVNIFGNHKVRYQPDGPEGDTWEIDFTPPFRRIFFIPELERVLHVKLPDSSVLQNEDSRLFLSELCVEHDIACSAPRTSGRLLNKLAAQFIEKHCIQPTFVMDHPEITSPLAKSHPSIPGLVERFELVIGKIEICNAYSELNDPVEQRLRFEQQVKDREAGDSSAQVVNEDFCEALEYGMPPTAGWGLGIERLAMILTNSNNIKEVITFPLMKPL